MFKINSAKITQIKDFLEKQIVLVNGTVYYLKPVSIATLEKVLHFDWQKNLVKLFFVPAKQDKNAPLSEELMQRIILELNFDFQCIANLHFYEQIQLLAFANVKDIWQKRALVVTVMGHVDHGKTTFLDTIRSSNLAYREHGKITQKIGGYQVEYQKNQITFIDTPGHQLFTSMRTQGVDVTDLIILIVAGNEGVKNQTVEAIDHAQAAKVPVIIFVNKMDLPLSNFDRVREQLDKYDLKHQLFDNQNFYLQGSCLAKKGINQLLQTLCDVKNRLSLEVNYNSLVKAVVLDSKIDHRGPQTTIIIQKGTLKLKDPVIVDGVFGRVRAIIDDLGRNLQVATPGMCVAVLGLNFSTRTGALLFSFPDFKLVINLANQFPKTTATEELNSDRKFIDPTQIWDKTDVSQNINLVVKLDTRGTEQVLRNHITTFEKDTSTKFKLNFLHIGIGAPTINDVNLALTSKGIIFAFNLKTPNTVVNKIKANSVQFYNFNVFSHLFDYLEKLQHHRAIDQSTEKVVGKGRILKIFRHSKFGVIAGCVVEKGLIKIGDERFRVFRNDQQIGDNLKIKSLKREKEVIKLATVNQEFGIIFDNFIDLEVGDFIEQFSVDSSSEK